MLNNSGIKLSFIIDELAEERGMDKGILSKIVIEGVLLAYQKKYPALNVDASYNKKDDIITIMVKKEVVLDVDDENTQISLRKAKSIFSEAVVGQEIDIPFDGKIGRIEIAKVRQLIAQKIKAVEAEAVFRAFEHRQGTLVNGTIHKLDSAGVLVLVYDTPALLPRSLSIPGENYSVGAPIRALVKEVHQSPRVGESQVILDRSSVDFVRKLFELEIPEVFDGLVRIEKMVRIAGYKTKILVSSRDMHVDPVGTCIGFAGSRIKPLLKELGEEKVDVIAHTSSPEKQIASALKPALVEEVVIKQNIAYATVAFDQRSAAIGKGGKNVALAAQLVGMPIELVAQDGESLRSSVNESN